MSCIPSLTKEQFCQRIQAIAEIPEKDFEKTGINADLSVGYEPKKKFFFFKKKEEWVQRQWVALDGILKICEEHLTPHCPIPYWSLALVRLERKCERLRHFSKTKTIHTHLLEKCNALRSKTLAFYPLKAFEHPKNDFLRFAMKLSFHNGISLYEEISRLIDQLGSLEDLSERLDLLYRIILLGDPKSVKEKKIFSESVYACFQIIYDNRITTQASKAFVRNIFSSNVGRSVTATVVMERWLQKERKFLASIEANPLKKLSQIAEKAQTLQFFYREYKEVINCASLLKLKSYKYNLMEELFFDLGTYVGKAYAKEKVLSIWNTLDYLSTLEDFLLLEMRKKETSLFKTKLLDLLKGPFFSHEKQYSDISSNWKKVMEIFGKSPDQFLCQLRFSCFFKEEKIDNYFKQIVVNGELEEFPIFFLRCLFHPSDVDLRELLLKRFSHASIQTSQVLAQALTSVGESTFFAYNFCSDMLNIYFVEPLMALYSATISSSLKKVCLELFCMLFSSHLVDLKLPQFPLIENDFTQMIPLFTSSQINSIARGTIDSAFLSSLTSEWISMLLDIAPSVSFRNVFNRPEMNDLKIIYKDQSFFIHSGILKRMSDFFAVMLEGDFKENGVTEIEIEDFELFDFFKNWLNLFDQGEPDFSYFPLEDIIDLLSLTDYFQMPIFEAVNQFLSDAFAKMTDQELYLFLASIFLEEPFEDFKEICPAMAKAWLDPLWIYPCFHNLQERFQRLTLQSE